MPPHVPILMYHRIAPRNSHSTVAGHYVHPGAFSRQMKALARRGYQTVPLSSFGGGTSKLSKPIIITFDDGYTNFYQNALPELKRRGFSSTVFLVSNLIGKTNLWDEEDGDVREPLMGIEEIRASQKEGTEFGSHTLDHADLSAIPHDQAWGQIADSKAFLQQVLGNEVTTFCYPYGRKTPEVEELVHRAGYRFACSTEKGLNDSTTNPLALRRINVRSDTLMPVFLYKLIRGARVAR